MPFRNTALNTVNERTLLRAVFDALPSLVFVVDRDVQIQEYNAAAAELMMAERETIILMKCQRAVGILLHAEIALSEIRSIKHLQETELFAAEQE
jgi:PAS domain-containing protein